MINKKFIPIKPIKIYGICLIVLCCTLNMSAQNTAIDSVRVITVDPYKPFLSNAFKIKENPIVKDTGKITPILKYQFLNKQASTNFNITPIKPARIKGEPLIKLYNGYAKVGIGTNTTPLAEVYFDSKRAKKYAYGFYGKHFSSAGINNIDYSAYSDNHLSGFGKLFTKQFTLFSKLAYDRNVVHYYGIPNDLKVVPNKNNIKQRFNKFSANVSLDRNFTDTTQFDYNFDMNYHYLNDLYQVAENNFTLTGELNKYYKKELYAIDLDLNYNQLNNTIKPNNTLIVGLKPHISTSTDNWKFTVGLGLYVNQDSTETKFHFYPEAEFKYNVVANIIIPYVGIKGGIIANNLNSFATENPFINTTTIALLNSNQKYNIYAGIRGSLSNNITFNTSFSKQRIEDRPLYVKDLSDALQNRFAIIYDNLDVVKITGELAYQKLEKFKIILTGNYFSYTTQNEIEAWHLPNYQLTLSGIYDLGDKIIAKLDIFAISKQFAKTYTTITTTNSTVSIAQSTSLNGIIDANISLEYRYTKKLSAFINFNNIGSVRYQRFQDYPTQRFGVLGGLTYSF